MRVIPPVSQIGIECPLEREAGRNVEVMRPKVSF
jgi:hypothetical protein